MLAPRRYNRNTFIEAAAELGISPGARLATSEWRAIRRQISRKPRLFSSRFIDSQLEERDEFRSVVRLLQKSPLLDGMYAVPVDVPATIQAGSKVTAYSRRFRILQRGTVMSYDVASSSYNVRFDCAEFGSEDCPDTEVASHGGAVTLVPATSSFVSPPAQWEGLNLPTGSRKSRLCGTLIFDLSSSNVLVNAIFISSRSPLYRTRCASESIGRRGSPARHARLTLTCPRE
jgi:hypothetical protein